MEHFDYLYKGQQLLKRGHFFRILTHCKGVVWLSLLILLGLLIPQPGWSAALPTTKHCRSNQSSLGEWPVLVAASTRCDDDSLECWSTRDFEGCCPRDYPYMAKFYNASQASCYETLEDCMKAKQGYCYPCGE